MPPHRNALIYSVLLAFVGGILGLEVAQGGDWPFWRGPESNGISRETGLIDDWDPRGGEGSNVVWQRDDLGGRSTPVVFDNRLYTMVRSAPGTVREGEKVVCVDATTGKTLWENAFNVYLSDVPDTRVGWSSCVVDPETGWVYAQGVCGTFLCLDGKTGKRIWSLPLHEQFGLLSTYGGRTNFPVISEDLVITSGVIIGWGDNAKPTHRFLAFHKKTGDVVWFSGTRELPYDTTYSSPSLTVLNGQKALVFGSGDGDVWAFQPRTGRHIWNFRFSSRGLNVSPLVVGDTVFSSHSEENIIGTSMGAVVAIDGALRGDITDTGEKWRLDEVMAGKSSPVAQDWRLYVCDDRAKLHVFDLETGNRIGKRYNLGTIMRSSPLIADGKLYAISQGGRWHILDIDDQGGIKKRSQGRLIKGDESHGSPICSNGRIYIPTTGRLYCLAAANKTVGATAVPPAPQEDELTDREPAHLQIVPCELLLKPGESQALEGRLYNAKGQFLSTTKLELSSDSAAEFSDQEINIPDNLGHTAIQVVGRAADLTGHARIRVVPDLPWEFDFEDTQISPKSKTGEPPIPWVGCRYRHVIRERDGNKFMVKITTIPKGTRSRGWLGHPNLHDYTIQADVQGQSVDGRMPDIGVTAQGYALDMQGANQQLQIRSWVPQLRMAKTIDFPWKAEVWYTMKLQSETNGDRVVLRGKVWPRSSQEPEEWTIEAEDPSPNLSGSPGLFGNAKDAEIYLDNIRVTPNL